MSMLMLLPNCHTNFDIMSITEGVVVTINPLLDDNYSTADRTQTKITGKRFEEPPCKLHTTTQLNMVLVLGVVLVLSSKLDSTRIPQLKYKQCEECNT